MPTFGGSGDWPFPAGHVEQDPAPQQRRHRLDAQDRETGRRFRSVHGNAAEHAEVVRLVAEGIEVRGVFSLSQIARQLGTPLQLPEVADNFAEIEAALVR